MVTAVSHEPKLGFLSARIIHHIEEHAEVLAHTLWVRIEKCPRLKEFRDRVPREEVQQRVGEIYRELGAWLQAKSEAELERRYVAIGERRAGQGVPLDQLVLAIVATKEHIWEYITEEFLTEHAHELVQALELSRAAEMFFDRAVYFAIVGYERHQHGAHHLTRPRG
jgi:hypothetical protein